MATGPERWLACTRSSRRCRRWPSRRSSTTASWRCAAARPCCRPPRWPCGGCAVAEIVVVGAGVGGLCAAIRLAAAGHRVTVLERNHEPGGKLAVHVRDGFHFDVGPSLLTMPYVFDEVLQLAGTSLAVELRL